jgi:hypothetical protein
VTVSMGDETRGSLSSILFVNIDERTISRGSTSLLPGRRMKSRKVYTSRADFSFATKRDRKG